MLKFLLGFRPEFLGFLMALMAKATPRACSLLYIEISLLDQDEL